MTHTNFRFNQLAISSICVIICFKLVQPILDMFYTYTLGKWLFSKRKQLKKAGQWAIVTGSTSGIGMAFAHELAGDGLDIFLLSRSEDKLTSVAEELERMYQVRTKYLAVDFTKTDIYEKIEQELSTLSSIACLVNNVGMTNRCLEEFATEPSLTCERLVQVINCNITSAACMTRLVLPRIVKQNSGAAIINVGSATACLSLAYYTFYSASKAWMGHFSACLGEELQQTNVIIQLYHPLLIATEMFGKKPRFFIPSAQTYARSALNMLGVKRNLTGYWRHDLELYAYSISPQFGMNRVNRQDYLQYISKIN